MGKDKELGFVKTMKTFWKGEQLCIPSFLTVGTVPIKLRPDGVTHVLAGPPGAHQAHADCLCPRTLAGQSLKGRERDVPSLLGDVPAVHGPLAPAACSVLAPADRRTWGGGGQ